MLCGSEVDVQSSGISHFYLQHVFFQALASLYIRSSYTLFAILYTEVLIDTDTHISRGGGGVVSFICISMAILLYSVQQTCLVCRNQQYDSSGGFRRR